MADDWDPFADPADVAAAAEPSIASVAPAQIAPVAPFSPPSRKAVAAEVVATAVVDAAAAAAAIEAHTSVQQQAQPQPKPPKVAAPEPHAAAQVVEVTTHPVQRQPKPPKTAASGTQLAALAVPTTDVQHARASPSEPAAVAVIAAMGDFVPSTTFQGPKSGMAFKTGPQGIGYYTDDGLSAMRAASGGETSISGGSGLRSNGTQKAGGLVDSRAYWIGAKPAASHEASPGEQEEGADMSVEQPKEEDVSPVLSAEQKSEIQEEVRHLKMAKQQAVEEEEFEEAANLKRRIKVLEDTLGEQVRFEELVAANEAVAAQRVREITKGVRKQHKSVSQQEHGEALMQMPSENMKLVPEEREFLTKSRMAVKARGVTDSTVNGVPQWAYKDALKEGMKGVKTVRPTELQYVFRGQIEDEKWEDGADFQASVIVQVPIEVAFANCTANGSGGDGDDKEGHRLQVGPGAYISHHAAGTATLTELLGAEVVENETVVFRITVVRPKVRGKVKLEAAQTVTTKQPFLQKPFYSFRSVWRLRSYPAGGTQVMRIVNGFKQYELMDFDALGSVSKSIDLENEQLRQSWSVAVAVASKKNLAVKSNFGQNVAMKAGIAAESDMYSASFVVDAAADQVFEALASNEILLDYSCLLREGSYLRLDESRALLRQVNGMVLLVTSRIKAEQRQWLTMAVAHWSGNTAQEAMAFTSDADVMRDPFYRVITEWICLENGKGQTLVKRSMRDFKQVSRFDITDLATVLTEVADEENRKIVDLFRSPCRTNKMQRNPTAISMRANYAMRQMPEILDMAAKNNVLEVREMLEVRGADPNYIHVREDTWAISDSRLTFYEEITPLVVAAEHGACEVIKVLFNHPQLDVNLCCCAFNDLEIYNYYTAYDMTISKKHPHAAALLRARGVLPASSEHVFKPPFDRMHMRPSRETVNNTYEEDYGEGEMPSWDIISEGNPELAAALREVADTLTITRSQSGVNRQKILKTLITDWHPDRHTASGQEFIATKVFQWLQVVKDWYMEVDPQGQTTEQQPLPDSPDMPAVPESAQQFLHPSGSVFQVW